MKKFLSVLGLFSSFGTLLCCALPALLVTLGLGGVLASLMGAVPQLVWVSLHKNLVFGFAAAMLVLGGLAQWRARLEPCPTNPAQAEACRVARKWSFTVYCFSVALYLIGGFFAYVSPLL